MSNVNGKTIIVTGAASGIGRAAALLLAKKGGNVVATDIQEGKLLTLADELAAIGGKHLTLMHDVTSEDEWKNTIKRTIDTFNSLDVLVNNAGVSDPTPFEEVTVEGWQRVMKTNTESVFIGSREAIAYMKDHGGGSLIHIASMAGLVGNSGSGAYTASKGALIALSKALATDFGKYNIRSNAICPGYIETEMSSEAFKNEYFRPIMEANTSLPYLGQPNNIAEGILFLASDASLFVTGTAIPIDGGVVAK